MPLFERYIGIDYSGAKTPNSSCKGLRVYVAEGSGEPIQVQPPLSPRSYWTRRGLAEWLREELDRDVPTLVGIDHAFSFPLAYFERYPSPATGRPSWSISGDTGRPTNPASISTSSEPRRGGLETHG